MPRIYRSVLSDQAAEVADKQDWIIESLRRDRTKESKRVKVIAQELAMPSTPLECAERLLGDAHDGAYIRAVANGAPRHLAESAVRPWRPSAFVRAVDHTLALSFAASEVATKERAGSSSRIVGAFGGSAHHARRASGHFGSVFNSLAAIALRARQDRAVLIVDLDGSCGGGTAELIAGEPRVRLVDVAVNGRDAYASTSNANLTVVTCAADYLATVKSALDSLDIAKEQDAVCIYSAGVDGFEGMETGLTGITADILAERDRLVFQWCSRVGLRTAYTLGCGEESGGCPRETLVALHRQTIETAAMEASGR